MTILFTNMETSSQIFLLVTIIHGTVAEMNNTGCLHDDGFYQCGNICTEKDNPCICGNGNISFSNTNLYCCLSLRETCSIENVCNEYYYDDVFSTNECVDSSEKIVCSTGKIVHRSQSCHGTCFEESNLTKDNTESSKTCEFTDHCDYEENFMCGDICTPKSLSCICGNITIGHANINHYCCLPPEKHCQMKTECLEYAYDDIFSQFDYDDCVKSSEGIECTSGQVTHKSEPCYGACHDNSKTSLENDGTITCDHVNFCDYNHQWYPQFMCGDLCMKVSTTINTVARNSICYCGNETLEHDSPQFCCTSPLQHCHYNGTDGICEAGRVVDKSETCHGVCYNSYRHSGILGDHAHLSCPDGKCVPVEDVRHELDDRCRGALVGVCHNSTQDRAANEGSRRFHNHGEGPY